MPKKKFKSRNDHNICFEKSEIWTHSPKSLVVCHHHYNLKRKSKLLEPIIFKLRSRERTKYYYITYNSSNAFKIEADPCIAAAKKSMPRDFFFVSLFPFSMPEGPDLAFHARAHNVKLKYMIKIFIYNYFYILLVNSFI